MADAQVGDFTPGASLQTVVTAPGTNGQHAADGRTPSIWAREAAITEAVADICQRRALIEQVKGVLMCVYETDADTAFELLRARSMDTNVKLRDLAAQLMTEFCSLNVRWAITDPIGSRPDPAHRARTCLGSVRLGRLLAASALRLGPPQFRCEAVRRGDPQRSAASLTR